MDIFGHRLRNTTAQDRRLKRWFFDVKPHSAAETPLFQRPAQHLLTGQTQKMGVPNHQQAHPDPRPTRGKGSPLCEPLRKIIDAVHVRSIHFFKIALMLVCEFVGSPDRERFPIV
jgi:hypothetical protein